MGTKIEWTDETWNPVTGCTKVSPGCANCYAERMARRLRGMGSPKYRDPFEVVAVHLPELERPDHWRRPRMVFVCSMGDLFHEVVPTDFIHRVFATMARNPQHVFQVLTKRAKRLRELAETLAIPTNVWVGVSVEDDSTMDRLYELAHVDAPVRFVSLEPLLGSVHKLLLSYVHHRCPLEFLQWVIVGGETGPGARMMPEGWPQSIRDACVDRGIPFFFKKWGDAYPTRGRILEGRTWDQLPEGGPHGPGEV